MAAKSLTKAQRARGAKLAANLASARTAVFQGRMNVRWNDAYRDAPEYLRGRYDAAAAEMQDFERAMADDGRGWMTERGHFAEFGTVMPVHWG